MSISDERKDFIAEHRDHVMDRRRFLLAWQAGALAAPLAAEAQEAVDKVRRIGFLAPDSLAARRTVAHTFTDGLRQLGYAEGVSVVVEYRWAKGKAERLAGLAADLVRLRAKALIESPCSQGRPGVPSPRYGEARDASFPPGPRGLAARH